MNMRLFHRQRAWALAVFLLCPEAVLAKDLILAVKSLEAEPYELAFQGFRETLQRKGYDVDLKEYILKEGRRGKDGILSEIRD
ncbi:MAG: hypothetical protein ACK4Z6_07045, partial [Candidatus Methylomirabilales bacterium]